VGENIIVIMRMRIIWSSLVRTNNKAGNKFVGKAVKIVAVEFGAGATTQIAL
jgi:hypothetical protein